MEPYHNPFWQGLYAFNDGSSLEDCPFPRQSDTAHFWYEGFALAHALVHGRGRKGPLWPAAQEKRPPPSWPPS